MKTMKNYLRSFHVGLVLCGLPGLVHAAGVVTEPTEANLRAALAGGGAVTFACDGVISLASPLVITNDTGFDASGRSVTLSGNNAVRVLQVNSGVQLTLNNLTVANGRTNRGAGIFNDGGTVTLTNCIVAYNRAVGTNSVNIPENYAHAESAYGGAVWNGGVFVASDTAFLTNSATGGKGGDVQSSSFYGNGGIAAGGAMWSTGNVILVDCTFQSNLAQGGDGGGGYEGGRGGEVKGGAILNAGGSVIGNNCIFQANSTVSGFDGGSGRLGYRGNAFGGGICSTGTLQLLAATFSTNAAVGANVGGGGVFHAAGVLALELSQFAGNRAQGDRTASYYAGVGGFAQGGAVFNGGSAQIADTTFSSNSVTAGNGNRHWPEVRKGGDGSGGGVFNNGTLTLLRSTLVANLSQGGVGSAADYSTGSAPGGRGFGGACSSAAGMLSVINSTLSRNSAVGGQGGTSQDGAFASPGGEGLGGAMHTTNGVIRITNSTVAANSVVGGPGGLCYWNNVLVRTGPPGQALTGGIRYDGGGAFDLYNSIVAQNTAGDVFGSFDGTPNLIGGDPRLSPLAANGGPTWTMALLPGSPAIDAAVSLPDIATDQRGVARPYGTAPDLGAYEWNGTSFPSDFHLSSLTPTNGHWRIRIAGPTNRSFRLCISSNLTDWREIRLGTTDERGEAECGEDSTAGWPACFYRVVSP